MIYILVIWLFGSAGNAPPVVVERYGTLVACEAAGSVWDATQQYGSQSHHHVCLPHP